MKILFLEDDILLNEIIQEHLENEGYSVKSTFTGYEAEELIYSEKFDLFLFYVNVPGITGFELLKNARQNDIKTPTIFLTSLNMVDDIEKGFVSGCDDYVKKPIELKELDIRINNYKKVVSIEELSINVWSYEDSPNPSTVRTYIKNLRKILGEKFITNIRGVGYKFNK